jgi:D-amino-acid dehydrogenase
MKVLIIGAGITGVNTAHALLDEGHEVTLLDPDGGATRASGAPSAGNAGWIATADIMPLASPKSIRQAVRWLTDPLAPLTIRPAYLPRIAPWLARFLWASRPSAVQASMLALTELQTRALPAWLAHAQRLGLERHIHRRGALYLHPTAETLEADRAYAVIQQRAGIAVDILSEAEARQLEPAIRPGIAGATFHADGAHISDPLELTTALREAAIARGARIAAGRARAIRAAERPSVVTEDGEIDADAIVVAAGIWSRPLAASLGEDAPLDTERGYNVSFRGVTGLIRRPVSFAGHGFVTTPLDSGLRIGGAVEFAGLKAPPNHERTRALHAKASRFLDGVPPFESGEVWMGFRPSLPDSLPVISPSARAPRVFYAFGHGHLGMTQSVVTGRLVADMMAGRQPAVDLAPFAIGRF